MVEEKRSDRRQSGSFFLAGNFGLCSEIVGVLAWRYHRIRRREDLLFSFGSERGPFPKDGPGHLGCRPSLSPAWRISPGSIILEDLESVSTTLFCCSCMDYSFRLLFAFVSMCRSRQAQFFLQVYRNSLNKRNWHLFRPRPQLFTFCFTLWHPFFTPRWQPRALREYTKLRYTYASKSRDLKAADSGFHFGPCAVRFIHWVACMVLFFANHGTSSFYRLLTLFCCTLARSIIESRRRSSGLCLRPWPSNKPSRASKPGWLTEKIKKKEAHLAAMSKKAPACFAKSSGHVSRCVQGGSGSNPTFDLWPLTFTL